MQLEYCAVVKFYEIHGQVRDPMQNPHIEGLCTSLLMDWCAISAKISYTRESAVFPGMEKG